MNVAYMKISAKHHHDVESERFSIKQVAEIVLTVRREE